MLKIEPLNALDDNYIWTITYQDKVIVIDPAESAPVLQFLQKNCNILSAILITHHHDDHIGGIDELVKVYPAPVWGPRDIRIPAVTHPVGEGDRISFFASAFFLDVMHTPGHTQSHLCYYNKTMIFCGDTLFSAGCGRHLEGNISDLQKSVKRISLLEDMTKIYCSHEYTYKNLLFAHHVEPSNVFIQKKINSIKYIPLSCSLPSTVGEEKNINPFIRYETSMEIKNYLHSKYSSKEKGEATLERLFSQLRRLKDNF